VVAIYEQRHLLWITGKALGKRIAQNGLTQDTITVLIELWNLTRHQVINRSLTASVTVMKETNDHLRYSR
jgi:hypothetical protein